MATINEFLKYFNAYPVEKSAGRKGDNMEKTVKITSIEQKTSKKDKPYWHVHTSPALTAEKALFLHREEQVSQLQVNKCYHFDFFTNKDGFIQTNSFEEVIDQNQDMIDEQESKPAPAPKGMTKEQEIGFYALMKGVSPMISGNLQLFVDYAGGDFEAGWLKARELVLDFVVDLVNEIRK